MLHLVLFTAALAQSPPDAPAGPGDLVIGWQLPKGGTLVVTQDTTTEVATPFGPQVTHSVIVSEQVVKKPGVLGVDSVAYDEKIVQQLLEIDVSGQKVSWDSTSEADPPAGLEAMPHLLSATWGVQVGKDRKVKVAVSNLDKIKDKVASAGAPEGIVDQALDEARLARAVEEQLALLPTGPVAVGQTWTNQRILAVPGLGDLPVVHTVTFDRVEAGRAHLTEKVALAGEAVVKSADLSVDRMTASGVTVWDLAAGLPTSRSVDLEMDLVVGHGEAAVAMSTTSRSQITVKLK